MEVEGAVFRGSFPVTPEQVCSWVGLPGEQEEAQSPGSSLSLLQAGSAVEELSGGQQWLASPVVPPALSCLSCSFWAPFHREGSGTQGTEPRDEGGLSTPSVAASSFPQVTPSLGLLLLQALLPCPEGPRAVPWYPHIPQTNKLTASLVFPGCTGTCGRVFPLPTPSSSAGKAPVVSPRERAVRHSMKQLHIIRGLNGVWEQSRELATSINSSSCRAA